MGWSFRVGRLAGIDIFVHFTFLILLGVIAVGNFMATGDVSAAAGGVLLTGAVFFIVVLHELGHALAARYYGIPTKDITLLPIGGVARLARMPDKPVQELVVALAGPAVNVALAGLLFAVDVVHDIANPQAALAPGMDLVTQLFWINVGLAVFNLLPAFPMDGGRVLRALLAMRLGSVRATTIAARVGQGMAVLFGLGGLLSGNFMLLLVALFVWSGADAEVAAVRTRSGLSGVPVAAVMARQFGTVDPDDPLGLVSRQALDGFQQDFPVVVGGRLVGVLSRDDLRYGLSEMGPDARVFHVMRRDFPTVGPEEPAEQGLSQLAAGVPVVPVVYYDRVVGLLTPETLSEFLLHRRAVRGELPRGYRDPAQSRA